VKKNQGYRIKNRLWICSEEGTFLGEGRISLLIEIEKHGSISKAAKSMNMSYKKAWDLINSMNSQSDKLLVIRKTGGKNGGGSELSEAGKKAIKIFTELNRKSKEFLDEQLKNIAF